MLHIGKNEYLEIGNGKWKINLYHSQIQALFYKFDTAPEPSNHIAMAIWKNN